jgi:hypothetical protein
MCSFIVLSQILSGNGGSEFGRLLGMLDLPNLSIAKTAFPLLESELSTSEMADRQFWGVVNHQSGGDARLQSEPCQPFGQNPKPTIGQNLIDL